MNFLAMSAAALLSFGTADEPKPVPVASAPGPELVIIAPVAMRDALAAFVEHKRTLLPTNLFTLEDALKRDPGADDAESLKKFLYREWKERHIRYVLLVGDADVMPVRFMVLDRVTPAAFDYAFYPSDLYYADVARADGSFDDWNANKEGFHAGYYGEVRGEKNKNDPMNYDGITHAPKLALGRWPVSTPEQARAVAAKTIAYDEAVGKGEIEAKAAAVSPAGWVDERARLRTMLGKLGALSHPWSIEERYFTDGNGAFKTAAADEKEVVGLLNGGCSLIVHAGHGSDDSWAGCFSTRSFAKLKEQKHPAVMISAGCSTARFCTEPPYESYQDVNGVEHKGTNAGEVFTGPPPAPSCYAKGKYNKTGLGEQLVCGIGPHAERGGTQAEPAAERRGTQSQEGPGSESRGTQGIGAICYIGCCTGSQPCAVTLEHAFVDAIAARSGKGEKVRVGDCWADAEAMYFEREHLATLGPDAGWYPASIFFQGMKYMLYGDPTVETGTPKK